MTEPAPRPLGASDPELADATGSDTDDPDRRLDDPQEDPQSDLGYQTPLGMRIAGIVASVLLGALAGAIGTLAHQLTTTIGGFAAPIGLIASCLAVVLLIAGLRLALQSRVYAALAALGVIAMVALLALPTAGDSAILPANARGVAWSVGPTILAAIVLAWPSGLRRRAQSSNGAATGHADRRRQGHGPVDEILDSEEELHQ